MAGEWRRGPTLIPRELRCECASPRVERDRSAWSSPHHVTHLRLPDPALPCATTCDGKHPSPINHDVFQLPRRPPPFPPCPVPLHAPFPSIITTVYPATTLNYSHVCRPSLLDVQSSIVHCLDSPQGPHAFESPGSVATLGRQTRRRICDPRRDRLHRCARHLLRRRVCDHFGSVTNEPRPVFSCLRLSATAFRATANAFPRVVACSVTSVRRCNHGLRPLSTATFAKDSCPATSTTAVSSRIASRPPLRFLLVTRHTQAADKKMKYLPVQDFEAVTSALNFNTPDCNVTGGCDLYTTKSTGSDKKLYKNIDKDLNSQHDALLKLGASLSPPDRAHMLATSPSMQLFSTSSAFGPLSELSSRRTFAYLIATLNASHPHYDFSHVLRPGDFKRERNLRRVMVNLDSILQNVRPGFEATSYDASLGSDLSSVWGAQCWSLIDKEMRLNECTIFSYQPDPDPFEEDESAIWAVHYFFFNRALKRVAYLYVRVVPVISSNSPTLRPMKVAQHKRHTDFDSYGATKRAKYWLGDRDAELVPPFEDDEGQQDDGLFWNRGEDGDLVPFSDDDYVEELDKEDEELDDDDDDDDDDDYSHVPDHGHDRLMSEDIAGRMEI
ncbi:Repressor of RNA polymerase III transcription MAF1 [Tolypocladium capitatum]|uniref:Repressor of RNA polymerase III transcription MAF1 n=1 Tax=Tolypocladium capitatum TaxID=45235 RepID=A0A2K3QL13_9HYPO|nr:Repressor of RNA polymerase III transcription MAF1 [Tolypocladium capitatum]